MIRYQLTAQAHAALARRRPPASNDEQLLATIRAIITNPHYSNTQRLDIIRRLDQADGES